ncbi:MAG: FHA domain-containing protein [Ruegeria sp.]
MFKYKSPLSRLLEGGAKTKDDESEIEENLATDEETSEPIADFNALRSALAGGNVSPESYEESEDLIPEEKMPDFDDGAAQAADDEVMGAVGLQVTQEEQEADAPVTDVDPVVTLLVTPEEPKIEAQPEPAAPEVKIQEVEEIVPEPQPEPQKAAPAAEQQAASEDRSSRVKTTFLGFERADTHVQDLMETAPAAKTETAQETFPVGWLAVVNGPGRGASITLTEGLMQIGRNDDQAIQLDFGDTGISRSNHAVIAYDPEDRKCYLGHGGKANLVRLNGKPVLSTTPLSNGDTIRISETSVRFVAFCDDDFDWRDA